MDVLCVGMYRACSTWQYDVAAHMVERYRQGCRLGFVQSRDYVYDDPALWRVLKSHEGGPAFRRAMANGRAIAIYAIRDVRDVVYSMLHKRAQSFDEFLRQGMIHQILANHAFWMSMPRTRVLVQRYELLRIDAVQGVREIASHLGISLSDETCLGLAGEYSFESNRRRADAAAERLRRSGVNPESPANAVSFDPHSLLHWNHLRTGKVGGWREEASDREIAILWHIVGRWLVDYGYAGRDESFETPTSVDRSTIAKGALACRMRCASLRFPRLSRAVKRVFGMQESYEAKPIQVAATAPGQVDRAA